MKIGRLLRTIGALEWPQLGGQVVKPAADRIVPLLLAKEKLPLPPSLVRPRSLVPLASHAAREALRFEDRVPFLEGRLLEFERTYALEAGADGGGAPDRWKDATAFTPFCASVRARRLAVALTLGAPSGFFRDVVRAARAVLLQLEVHLLGNHFLENGLGLLAAGAITGGTEGRAFRAVGGEIVARELRRQFLLDGAHVERSITYHLHLVAALLEVKALLLAHDHALPRGLDETLLRALPFALAVRAPDGTYPLFNDASLDAAPSIDDVMALARGLGELVSEPRFEPLRSLRNAGLCVAALGDFFLAFDAGEDGYRQQPGHVHADALTFELWHRGNRTVVDYGVGSYAVDEERVRTRATRSHNTLELDGSDSAEVWSAFRTGRFAKAHLVAATLRPGEVTATAQHAGYRALPGKPMHLRSITLSEQGVKVVDRYTGRPSTVASRLRLVKGASLEAIGSAEVRVSPTVWHPRFRRPEPAVLFEQSPTPGGDKRLEWRLIPRSS